MRWALGSGTRLTLCWLPWQTQPLLSAPELLWKRHLSLPLLTALAGLSLGQALKVGAGSSKVMKIGSHSPQRAESGAVRQKNQGPDLGQGQQYLAMVELQTDFWGLSLHTRANNKREAMYGSQM